ncbi:DUF4974 domain-containing protein [Maribellus comscasis]|uniref:DUF4974 domain-containing protein n=1 Tax=Maribellus comscasis TaxID=2681766 RepID=A0A6I6JV39_9BACT|nr:FecR domain-containing protein [Maribellus comscasis]QGY46956.1 DUF4974 domain-containing protein [Maribellus comscasis]
MKKEEIIKNIIKSKSSLHSSEFLSWVQKSEENRKEFIRYKNLWALLKSGNELDRKYINDDFILLKRRMKESGTGFKVRELIKYAAIIVLALIGGYLIHSIPKSGEVFMNEVSVPKGNRSSIVLPDGSEVWLTNGSKLIYPEVFNDKIRNVKLEGEAYFKISHDASKPFTVDLGEQQIKVLGTEFSVLAYPDDNIVQVDLITGKVQLDVFEEIGSDKYKSYQLKPSYSLVLDKTSGSLKNYKIPDSFYKYWQQGIYEFKNESFVSLAKKIDRIYGIKVIFEDNTLKGCTFTGAFFLDSNIYTIIETFRRASSIPFEYTIDNNQIYLKREK